MSKVSKEGDHHSRFNRKRIEYTLKANVKPFTGRDSIPGYFVKKGGQDGSPSSALIWTDNTLTARADLPGDTTLKTQEGAAIFTSASGASITYFQDGSMIYAASLNSPVSGRERLRREQATLPWWERDKDVIENEYISEAGLVVASPVPGLSTQKNTPYTRFQIAVPVSDTETKTVDCFAYGQVVSMVNRRNLKKDESVRIRASIQFHEQRLPGGRSVFTPWLRLFDVQKIK